MLVNLVENAIKYTASSKNVAPTSGISTGLSPGGLTGDLPPKSVRIAVGQFHKEGKEWTRVQVIDNGPGITADHLPHLFDRFYQVDPSRTQLNSFEPGSQPGEAAGITPGPGGSGLGLAIVKWVVEAHHGQIVVRSPALPDSDQKGVCFEVWFPLLKTSI